MPSPGGNMTASARLAKAKGDLELVSREVRRAISLAALYTRCTEARDVVETMSDSVEGWGFITVRDALHRDLIVTLMGVVHRRGQDRTACLGVLIEMLGDPQVVKEIERSPSSHQDSIELLASARRDYEGLCAGPMLKALRALRDKVIAHVERGDVKHGARLGDEREILLKVIPIVEKIAKALNGEEDRLMELREAWAENADAFWSHVARPQEWREEEGQR
jgi:hypothetical protein